MRLSIKKRHVLQFLTSFILGAFFLFLLDTYIVLIGLPSIEPLLLSVWTYGAGLEEIIKFLVSFLIIRRFGFSPLTAAFVGLGFGVSEQLIHVMYGDKALIHVAMMHYASGLASAFYFYRARKEGWVRFPWKALIAPVAVHAVYNLGIWVWLMYYTYFVA